MEFRNRTPKRRSEPKTVTKYSDSKPELCEDFNHRCGYCDDHVYFKTTFYEVDHFVPKGVLVRISETDYSNLVYSCRSCNNAKRQKWPTGDETKHNDGVKGFIDPCSDEYAKQFSRSNKGDIVPETKLGKWMWNAMRLYNPSHRIIWSLEQLRCRIEEMEALDADNRKILELYRMYLQYEDELRGEKPNF
jgi:uncharacterized protein (TIGR02646 family)